MFYDFPPDSAQSVYFLEEENLWMDEDGETYLDLTEFGFTAFQRNTILIDIRRNYRAEYMYVTNNYGEPVEIFWEALPFAV
jgi:hypothetical protein